MSRDNKNLYKRKYRLRIAQPVVTNLDTLYQGVNTASDISPQAVQQRRLANVVDRCSIGTFSNIGPVAIERSSLDITDLQIKATLKLNKGEGGTSYDKSIIYLYNLSKDYIERIAIGQYVYLDAGYDVDDSLPSAYRGTIAHIVSERSGSDTITSLYCSDMYRQRASKLKINKKWPPQTSKRDILKDLINEVRTRTGISVGDNFIPNVETGNSLLEYLHEGGYQIYGTNIFDAIDKVCSEINFHTYFVNGIYYVEPINAPQLLQEFKVKKENVKEFIKKKITFNSDKVEEEEGISIKLFLDARITTAGILTIEEDGELKSYNIDKVTHYLDYEGDWWETEVTAKLLKK